MNKEEREKLRKEINSHKLYISPLELIDRDVLLGLLERVDVLECQVDRRGNIILRAIGWIEEVHCISQDAEQEQRSFVNEMRVAITASEVRK